MLVARCWNAHLGAPRMHNNLAELLLLPPSGPIPGWGCPPGSLLSAPKYVECVTQRHHPSIPTDLSPAQTRYVALRLEEEARRMGGYELFGTLAFLESIRGEGESTLVNRKGAT